MTLAGTDRLGQIASATAGFRDQFYGLAPYVIDLRTADDHAFPRLVTCGVIDPGQCAWGQRSLRFAGKRYEHPRVDLAAMTDNPLRRWVADRLVPKVVLATQTKVLEAAVDVDGTWIPSTPVIAVHAPPDQLFRVAAVLLAPPVSAWASSVYAGVALTSDAIKLSARQVLEIPLPTTVAAWERGRRRVAVWRPAGSRSVHDQGVRLRHRCPAVVDQPPAPIGRQGSARASAIMEGWTAGCIRRCCPPPARGAPVIRRGSGASCPSPPDRPFVLEGGGSLRDISLAYETWGELDADVPATPCSSATP